MRSVGPGLTARTGIGSAQVGMPPRAAGDEIRRHLVARPPPRRGWTGLPVEGRSFPSHLGVVTSRSGRAGLDLKRSSLKMAPSPSRPPPRCRPVQDVNAAYAGGIAAEQAKRHAAGCRMSVGRRANASTHGARDEAGAGDDGAANAGAGHTARDACTHDSRGRARPADRGL